MQRFFILAFVVLSLLGCLPGTVNPALLAGNYSLQPIQSKMNIKIGDRIFTATLHDNATAAAFKVLLPIKANMVELNGNEKYVDLPTHLPANAVNPGTIHTGDLMLWNSNTLVLFYKTFSTSYNYTRLGKIDDTSGLVAALGSGNVAVSFELK